MKSVEAELAELESQSLKRVLKCVQSPQNAEITIDGCDYVNFSSNDYLGLSSHETIKQAFKDGVDQWGAGSGASRLISGSLLPHVQLEQKIAEYKGKPAARVFANGYATSVGVLSGLLGKDDVVILDKLSHASLIDGARLSGATIRVFPHNDMAKLEKLLQKYQHDKDRRVLLVTESIFSMDGNSAALREIVELKRKYSDKFSADGLLLLVDEAHALGVCGAMGLVHQLGLADQVDFHMGTLGKAAGVAGGYVACSQLHADLIVNRSRSFIYSTAPPPAQSVAAIAALELIHQEQGTLLRKKLWSNIQLFTELMGMETLPESAIIAWHVGDSEEALALSQKLADAGIAVPAVRYPTVPRGTARLRITLSAAHSEKHIRQLCKVLTSQ